MRKLLFALCAPMLLLCACTTAGTTSISDGVSSALAVARTGIDATAHAFDAALYGLDVAMDFKLLTPGSDQAKQIAVLGRKVQAALNRADAAVKAGNSPGAKAALEEADSLISQFRSMLPARSTTGMATPALAPHSRAAILARAAA